MMSRLGLDRFMGKFIIISLFLQLVVFYFGYYFDTKRSSILMTKSCQIDCDIADKQDNPSIEHLDRT